MKKYFLLPAVAVLMILATGCVKLPQVPAVEESSLNGKQQKSLASVKKLNEYPFYQMNYYGDYSELASVNRELVNSLSNNRSQCTSIASHDKIPLFGRNHDYSPDPVLFLFTSPPNKYKSVSMVDLLYIGIDRKSELKTLKDKSPLLYAPFAPCDGMNEKGLAIGIMARDDQISYLDLLTGKSIVTNKKAEKLTSSLMIIREVLDNASTVDEAVEIFKNHRIYFFATVRLHYLVSDRFGKSAVIEYENDELKIIYNSEAWQVSTNHGIFTGKEELRKRLKTYWQEKGLEKINEPDSYWRYITASHLAEEMQNAMSPQAMMNILQKVSMEFENLMMHRITNWSVVYDQKNLTARVATGRDYKKVYTFTLGIMP